MARKFTLLRLAMELAVEAGEAGVAINAIDAIAEDFDVAPLRVKLKVLPGCIPNLDDANRAARFVRSVNGLIDQALAAGDFDGASSLADLLVSATARSWGQTLRNHARQRRASVQAIARLAADLQQAEATLAEDAEHPSANLVAGRWYCLVKEEWQQGLPLLAKGSSAKLASLAKRELAAHLQQPKDMVDLADQWWDVGRRQRDATKGGALRRAGYWYAEALDKLALDKIRQIVEQRLAEIEKIPPALPTPAKAESTSAGAIYYVSARRGDDESPGTRRQPWKSIRHATSLIRPGDTVVVLPGVYRQERFDFRPGGTHVDHRTVFRVAWNDNCGGRAVLTHPDGETPDFSLAPNTRVEGLWIGGSLPADPKASRHGFTNQAGIELVRCTVWSSKRGLDNHMYGLLCGNTAVNMLMVDNLLVHLGGHWFGHAIYVSGGPPPTTQNCRVVGNVFLEGGGFAIHCWHAPKNITIVANFVSGHTCGLVAQGPGHMVHHNVIWKPLGKPDDPGMNICAMLPNDLLRFDHNVLASTRPIDGNGRPQHPPVHNYNLAGQQGKQVNLIPLSPPQLSDLPWVGQTPQEIDAATQWLDAYFSERTPEQIAEDTTEAVEDALRVLRVKYAPAPADLASRPISEP